MNPLKIEFPDFENRELLEIEVLQIKTFSEKRRKSKYGSFCHETEIGCISIYVSVYGRTMVDLQYITKYLMALFQFFGNEPPFRANLLLGVYCMTFCMGFASLTEYDTLSSFGS